MISPEELEKKLWKYKDLYNSPLALDDADETIPLLLEEILVKDLETSLTKNYGKEYYSAMAHITDFISGYISANSCALRIFSILKLLRTYEGIITARRQRKVPLDLRNLGKEKKSATTQQVRERMEKWIKENKISIEFRK